MAEKSIFDENSNISLDTNLPIEDILKSVTPTETSNVEAKEVKTEEKVTQEPKKEKELSPLEKLKLEQKNAPKGLMVSNEELKEGAEKPKENIVYNEKRMNDFKKAIDSYDTVMKQREAVMVLKEPKTQEDYFTLINEIEQVKFDNNGKAFFPEGFNATMCRIREANEKAFDFSKINDSFGAPTKPTEENIDPDGISEEKRKIVNVIIDKTGLGSDFSFTDEEKEKLVEAETIKVTQVKTLDIAAIKAKRSDKTFQQSIKDFSIKGSRATICFPASGFRAQMKGLTYGEYADIAISTENITFDRYYKRLSIIYNKMVNISTGPFKDFEDFLKNFAYTDISLAIYGLYIATEKENQEIALSCGNTECKKNFDWKFNTRSILRLERCADKFLEKMNELSTADAIDFDRIKSESAVQNSFTIELPESKIAVEMGIASAYDFLYNFIPLMDPDTFKASFGEDLNEVYMTNMLLLTTIRAVYVPTDNGEYVECTGYKDILDAVYNISLPEIQILAAYAAKLEGQYRMSFAFENVVCPHCGNITKQLEISIDDLVFQSYQRSMSTEIDVSQIQDF